ncbi:MAG: hypothetical protein RLZZ337_1802 [Bacteroidota bacterium]
MRSLQFGAYGHMLHNIVASYLGYIQIHQNGFWDEKTLDNSFNYDEIDTLSKLSNVAFIGQRIEGFALASYKDISKPVALLGVQPKEEQEHIKLGDKVIEGNYLTQYEKGLLIAKGLKEIMGVTVGDTLVFLGQGFQGSIASGKFPIVGIVDLKTPELNKRTVILNLSLAQELFGMPGRITTATIGLEDDNWQKTERQLIQVLDTNALEVMNWQQMIPELHQLITVDRAGGTFVLVILYLIITFGLFGTVLMLTEERSFEFGVLLSLGMARKTLIKVTILETLFMGIIGIILGLVVATPVVVYFHYFPINLSGQIQEVVEQFGFEALLPTSLDITIGLTHASILFGIVFLVNTYTIWKIKNTNPIKAMKR